MGAVVMRPLERRVIHALLSRVGAGAVVLERLGRCVGLGCLQFMLLRFSFNGSCMSQRQCGHVHIGVALSVLRCVFVLCTGGSCPMGV